VLVSADGRFLYATNRGKPFGAGENSVAVFAIDGAGALRGPVQWATGGADAASAVNFPRHAALVPLPGEPYLVVANQLGGSLTVFSRDPATGLLAFAAAGAAAPTTAPSFVLPLL
jgi:6-phosphogluconolactonase